MPIPVIGSIGLSFMVGGASLVAADITDSTGIALTFFISGMVGVAWLVARIVNWQRDVKADIDELRRQVGLPPKQKKQQGEN